MMQSPRRPSMVEVVCQTEATNWPYDRVAVSHLA
jgi:hypothetical protein